MTTAARRRRMIVISATPASSPARPRPSRSCGPPRLRRTVAHLHRLVRGGRIALSAGGALHRGPVPRRPRQRRRQHRLPAPGHVRHIESSRVGQAGVALPGPGVRASLKGWGRRLAEPQRQAGALTADVLSVIRLTAPKPRARGRGLETPAQAAQRARFDLALVAVLSDGGLRRSEAAALTWGDVQRWDDGSGRITVVRSKTDTEAQGAVVAITPAAMNALDAIRPAGVDSPQKVFGLSESQIARRVKVIAGPRGWPTGSSSAATAGASAWPGAWPRTARPPTRSSARAAGSRAAGWWPLHPRRICRIGVAVSLTGGPKRSCPSSW